MSLFTPDAPWSKAASHVQVFKIYPQWMTDATDAELRQQFADLKRRGIGLALEWGLLNSPDCAGGEGIGGLTDTEMYADTAHAANRIKSNGGDLRYVAMDHPFDGAGLYTGPNACRWSAEQVANNASQNFKAFQEVFPGVRIGDIETPSLESSAGTGSSWTRGGRLLAFPWRSSMRMSTGATRQQRS